MRHSTLLGLTLALAVALSLPATADAWSDQGHKTICQIALLELAQSSPAVKEKVVDILSQEHSASGFRSFPTSCTWADRDKRTPGTIQNKRRNDHFVNFQRDESTIAGANCPMAAHCLFTAIASDMDALKSETGVRQRRALKFLGHWIGDLHQPLHVSFQDDLGGNELLVDGLDCSDLHATWDRCIPARLLTKMGVSSYVDLGTVLQAEINDTDRTSWKSGSLSDWAAATYALTRTTDLQYCTLEGGSCCYPDASDCEQHGDHMTTLTLDDDYLEAHVDTVRTQMKKAGVRLARLLEQSLGSD
jgi:hypothetical protein